MNRDIEFRGLTGSVKGDIWVYGTPYKVKSLFSADERYYIRNKHANDHIVDPKTIGQYTGLKDKNGKKIFEGDIIDIHQTVNGYNQFVIEYDKYKFSARYYNQDKKQTGSWYGYDLDELFEINESEKEIEVIGNIYENKELLEG